MEIAITSDYNEAVGITLSNVTINNNNREVKLHTNSVKEAEILASILEHTVIGLSIQ